MSAPGAHSSKYGILCSRLNALASERWLSVITAQTLYPALAKSSIHLLILHFNHLPVIFISGRERITAGIDFFKEVIIESTITLNKFPSSSCPRKSPLWYCTDFCNYISSMIKTQSPDSLFFQKQFGNFERVNFTRC